MGNCGGGETKPQNPQTQTTNAGNTKMVPVQATEEATATKTNKNENQQQEKQIAPEQPSEPKKEVAAPTSSNEPIAQDESKKNDKPKQQQKQQEVTPAPQAVVETEKPASKPEDDSAAKKQQQQTPSQAAPPQQQQQQEQKDEAAKQAEVEKSNQEREQQEAALAAAQKEEEKKKKQEQEQKDAQQKQRKLEAAILAYQAEIEASQKWKPDGPGDLRERSIHRACLNNPSIIQLRDLFGKNDPIVFREMVFKMRIKKGLVGRSGFHEVLGLIIGSFFFYFPANVGDASNSTAEAVACLGSTYLKGIKISEMEPVEMKRRILLEASVPRKKGDGKGSGDEASLQIGFATEEQKSKFLEIVENLAIPKPNAEVAAALKASGRNLFIGRVKSMNDVTVNEGTGAASD